TKLSAKPTAIAMKKSVHRSSTSPPTSIAKKPLSRGFCAELLRISPDCAENSGSFPGVNLRSNERGAHRSSSRHQRPALQPLLLEPPQHAHLLLPIATCDHHQ